MGHGREPHARQPGQGSIAAVLHCPLLHPQHNLLHFRVVLAALCLTAAAEIPRGHRCPGLQPLQGSNLIAVGWTVPDSGRTVTTGHGSLPELWQPGAQGLLRGAGLSPGGFRICQRYPPGDFVVPCSQSQQWQTPRLDGQDLASMVSLLVMALHRGCGTHHTLSMPPAPAPLVGSQGVENPKLQHTRFLGLHRRVVSDEQSKG